MLAPYDACQQVGRCILDQLQTGPSFVMPLSIEEGDHVLGETKREVMVACSK